MMKAELLAYLASNLFRIYVLFQFTDRFFQKSRVGEKWILTSFLLYFAVNSISFIFFPITGMNIISNLIPYFLLTFCYQAKTSVRVLVTVIVYSISIFVDIALFSVQYLLHTETIVVSSGVATSLLLFLIERLYAYFFTSTDDCNKAEIHAGELLLIIFVPMGSLIIAAKGMHIVNYNYLPESIVLFGINGIVFYIYDALKKSQRERIEKMELEQQNLLYESQMKLQKESEEKVRILRHDMKNHFYQMKSLLRLKKLYELEEYMNHIIQTTESTGDFCKSGNADVDGIVNLKLSKAKEMGAELHFDFKIPEKLNIETFDMNCILGNLLDNVLDAFENVERRIVYLQMTYQKGVLNFCLRNSFNGQLKVNEKNQLLSIKQGDAKRHGLGVKSIIETVERYDGEFEYECEGNVFSVYIMMYER